MFGELLETKAHKQRRSAGVLLSIGVHVAIIALIIVQPVRGAPVIEKPQIVRVAIIPAKPREIKHTGRVAPTTSAPSLPTNLVVRHIDAPNIVPAQLPPIDMTAGIAADSLVIGGKSSASIGSVGSMYGTEMPKDSRDWDAHEILMHVLTPARPRYPESLRSAGVDGRVLVQFTVDTTGRVDRSSVKVLESTHDLFTRAVRDALGSFRFIPAQVDGRRVPALAQMPFEFHIAR